MLSLKLNFVYTKKLLQNKAEQSLKQNNKSRETKHIKPSKAQEIKVTQCKFTMFTGLIDMTISIGRHI